MIIVPTRFRKKRMAEMSNCKTSGKRFEEMICPVCKRVFSVPDPGMWAYKIWNKKSSRYQCVCRWKCLLEDEKRKEEEAQKKRAARKKKKELANV